MNNFVFYHETHKYELNGIPIPSVTTVIKDVIRYHKKMWKDPRLTAEEQEENSEAYKQFGIAVHKACELHIKGKLNPEQMDQRLNPALQGFMQFLDATEFKVKESETKHYNKELFYAGTLDLYGEIKGKKTIIDIKTGKDYKHYPIQTAAYALLRDKEADRYVLLLDRDNPTFDLRKHEKKADFIYWEHMLGVYHGKKRYGGVHEHELVQG